MSKGLGALIAGCGLAGLVAVANLSAETIPAGTPLEIRIQQPISSYSTPAGTKITGILISPVSEGGNILVPLGTTIEGEVVFVRRVGLGVAHETAQIELRFDHLVLADHGSVPVQVRITSVENARSEERRVGKECVP